MKEKEAERTREQEKESFVPWLSHQYPGLDHGKIRTEALRPPTWMSLER